MRRKTDSAIKVCKYQIRDLHERHALYLVVNALGERKNCTILGVKTFATKSRDLLSHCDSFTRLCDRWLTRFGASLAEIDIDESRPLMLI